MFARRAWKRGCVPQSEEETDGRAENKRKEWARRSQEGSDAVPSESFCRRGSGDRRRRSWHIAAWGSTASHSSPLPVGTQTSWCTFTGRMNNSSQPPLQNPPKHFQEGIQKNKIKIYIYELKPILGAHTLAWVTSYSTGLWPVQYSAGFQERALNRMKYLKG